MSAEEHKPEGEETEKKKSSLDIKKILMYVGIVVAFILLMVGSVVVTVKFLLNKPATEQQAAADAAHGKEKKADAEEEDAHGDKKKDDSHEEDDEEVVVMSVQCEKGKSDIIINPADAPSAYVVVNVGLGVAKKDADGKDVSAESLKKVAEEQIVPICDVIQSNLGRRHLDEFGTVAKRDTIKMSLRKELKPFLKQSKLKLRQVYFSKFLVQQ